MAIDTVLVGNVSGNAWVRQADGSLLALRAGMRVPANAEVVTDSGASVQLQGDGMQPITLGENRQLQVSDELANADVDPSGQTVPAQLDPESARVLAALQAGEDPFEQLDPTAAVNSGGGDGAGGSSFTRLVSIVEATSPLALAYPKPLHASGELPRMGGYGRGEEAVESTTPILKITINDDGTVTFKFSELPVGFDASDVNVSGGGRIENLRPDPTDPTKWVADLIVPDNYEGDIVVHVPDGSYTGTTGVPGLGDEDTITVDTLPPEAEIAIDVIAGDDVINKAESEGDITITGTVGKDVKPGDKVTVTVGGKEYETTVNPDGRTWNVDVPGSELANNDKVEAKVTTTDDAGNSTTVTTDRGYDVHTTLPTAEIKIDADFFGGDGKLNNAESKVDQVIHGTVGGDVQDGDKIIVMVGGNKHETTALDGKWSITVPKDQVENLKAGEITAKVSGEDDHGNPYSADDAADYTVHTTLPTAEIKIDADFFGGDGKLNNAESKVDQVIHGTVGGDVQDGDKIIVMVGGNKHETTALDGKWSITVPKDQVENLKAGEITAKVSGEDDHGNPYSADDAADYTVHTTLPTAEIKIDADFFGGDGKLNNAESKVDQVIHGTVGGDVQDGDKIIVMVGGNKHETTALDGKWSITVPKDQVEN
ncbi:retention module-containing protein, partial [Paenalcaligenes sp. Me131]|uniref:retention module-containing protein n=1 Tax=Paenalcaligenes sp. Me131 TaxID=3392636 RepID=UPI003D2A9A50